MFDELAERSLMSPLAGTKHAYVRLAIIAYCQILAIFFKFANGILRNWESLCDIRPYCHHHFDASGISNAMFDESAERSLMSLLPGTKHTYVRLAIMVYCQILALLSSLLLLFIIIEFIKVCLRPLRDISATRNVKLRLAIKFPTLHEW